MRKRKSKKKSSFKLRRGIAFGKRKSKTPTSLSIFPDKSPQLQEKGVPTKLNAFTTKNVSIRDSKGREFNAIINDKLSYKRAARGQNVEDFSEVMYGPSVKPLTKINYKKLKKGDKIYYDRGSSAMRGPFLFINISRGPEILMEVKDTSYDKKYLFSIAVNRLDKEKIYITSKNSNSHSKTRHKQKRKMTKKLPKKTTKLPKKTKKLPKKTKKLPKKTKKRPKK
jgi:hypothetical protein